MARVPEQPRVAATHESACCCASGLVRGPIDNLATPGRIHSEAKSVQRADAILLTILDNVIITS